ncbi:MAG: DUF4123 domain-containing protein [Myxococcales bacterium]|nr:DUF4123 domain-containing protein [Myxococcales bacterium]
MAATPRSIAEQIYELAARDEAQLYAVLDACRCDVAERVSRHGVDYAVLWQEPGAIPAELRGALPYVVLCRPRRAFARWLFSEGWGHSWGVLAIARAGLGEVARHLRSNLMAQLPDGKRVFFRFYDPRVLRPLIPTCTPEQVSELYGPVLSFVMEDEQGQIRAFRRGAAAAASS